MVTATTSLRMNPSDSHPQQEISAFPWWIETSHCLQPWRFVHCGRGAMCDMRGFPAEGALRVWKKSFQLTGRILHRQIRIFVQLSVLKIARNSMGMQYYTTADRSLVLLFALFLPCTVIQPSTCSVQQTTRPMATRAFASKLSPSASAASSVSNTDTGTYGPCHCRPGSIIISAYYKCSPYCDTQGI